MPGDIHLLTHEFAPATGGIGVYVEETARALAALGAPPTVWAPDYGGACSDAYPFPVRRVPMRGRQDWLCRLTLGRKLRQAFPDGTIPGTVVLAEPGPLRLFMYRDFLGLPRPQRLVVILHGTEVNALGRIVHRRRLLRALLQEADAVGVVSDMVGGLVRAVCPHVAARLVTVHGAVRTAWQDLPPVPRDPARRPLDILHVGRLHPRKGQLQLVEAIALLPPEVLRGIRLRVIGPETKPAYAATVRDRAAALGLPVQFEGALGVDDLRRAYETAALLAMPSQPAGDSLEGLGLALLEAQHFGCPVVATRIGGIPEAVRDGETGILVPPGDPPALAAALQRLLHDPFAATRMAAAAARFVRAGFSWQANARRLGLV